MRSPCFATLMRLFPVLAFGAGGPSTAFAHGHEIGWVAMVICGENGAQTVCLDGSGQSVDPNTACLANSCDLCVASAATAAGNASVVLVPPDHGRAVALHSGLARSSNLWPNLAAARALPAGGKPA